MIRILQVIGGMNQGGAENFLMNLYRNIDRNKIQFDFLVNRDGIFDDEIKALGGNIFQIPALQKVGPIKYNKTLDSFLNEHRKDYDIIHSHLNQVTGLILERANKAGYPIRIAHSHSSGIGGNIMVTIYKKHLGKKIFANATILIGCSDKAIKYLYKGHEDDAILINNGIDLDKFRFNKAYRDSVRDELNIKQNETVIGHVGRFVKVKNHTFLLDVFKEYNKLNEHSKLVLVGDGEMRDEIEDKIKKYNLEDKVILTGNRTDVNKVLQALDIFVFPSINEGLPLSLIEAQIAGLNVVCSDSITNTVDVTGNVTFLSLHDTAETWANALHTIDTKHDRTNEFEKVKQAGYDIKDVAKQYTELIQTELAKLETEEKHEQN